MRGLARAVLGSAVVEAARAALEAEPAFLLTRGVQLAALILQPAGGLPAGQPAGKAAGAETRTVERKERWK